jgi:hypothetical protein
VILANLRMLDEVPKDVRDPIIVIWRTLARLDLHEFRVESSSSPDFEPDEADSLSQLTALKADELDAQRWAELVAQSLSSSLTDIDLPIKYLSDFADHLSERISCQRRLGRIDEARRSTDRMHAFARLLAARYPDQPVAHLALSASFTQIAKNAWNTNDRSAVERNWNLALDEARRALMLDPQDARAGARVADFQKRLALLLASKPEPRGPNGSARTAGASLR